MGRRQSFFFPVLLYLSLSCAGAKETVVVPEGFTVRQFAGNDMAPDIWCMTIDPDSDRICVGGPGYIRFILDEDDDGVGDRSVLFTDAVRKGPMGLLIDGEAIISVEANAVIRYLDQDGDLRADGPGEELLVFSGKGGEHGPHGIRKGPDGWYYVVCGNNAGVDHTHASLASSPVRDPSQGCIIRFDPGGEGSEIVADGFRNPYDIAFDDRGRLFTFDSDNERDHHLPWYASNRLFDVAVGHHHGWLNPGHRQSYNTPEYYSVDRLAEVRRGSPTGVEFYWHDAFPEPYRAGLFYACWTFGRIYFSPLQWEEGASVAWERRYRRQEPEIFARAASDGGFAPVDLAVDRKGNLWVACGGRSTSGKIFVISPREKRGEDRPREMVPVPRQLVGRVMQKPGLNHPHTVRTFLKDERDLHLVYRAFQEIHGGINHLPEPRIIDAGYSFAFNRTLDAEELREQIIAESGAAFLSDMDLRAEDELTRDAEALAAFYESPLPADRIEKWRDRNYKELARTLGCVRTEFAEVLEDLTTALREDTHPTDDIHYLFCTAQIPAPRTSLATWRTASAFLRLDAKLAAIPGAHPSRNWPLRLQDVFRVHCELDPRLRREVMWSHSLFGSSIGHARFIETIDDPELRKEVTRKMYLRVQNSEMDWSRQWARLVMDNLDLSATEWRLIWDGKPMLRDILAPRLVEQSDPDLDAGRLCQALDLDDSELVLSIIRRLPPSIPENRLQAEAYFAALVRHFRKEKLVEALLDRIEADSVESALVLASSRYPDSEVLARLRGREDLSSFMKRLESIDWEAGQSDRGELVYRRRGCGACHGGQNRLGPGLNGIASRLGREDFFRHTVSPNLAISELYQASEIETNDGTKYIGVPVYQSPDQTLLETGPGVVVNLSQGEIRSTREARFSPMPEGLLIGVTDAELADMWTFVSSL